MLRRAASGFARQGCAESGAPLSRSGGVVVPDTQDGEPGLVAPSTRLGLNHRDEGSLSDSISERIDRAIFSTGWRTVVREG